MSPMITTEAVSLEMDCILIGLPRTLDPKVVTRFDQHLGYGNRLILCNYKKRNQLHFCKYTPEGKSTTQGITLPLAKLHILKRALKAAETHAKAEGVFAEEKKKKSG